MHPYASQTTLQQALKIAAGDNARAANGTFGSADWLTALHDANYDCGGTGWQSWALSSLPWNTLIG